MTEMDISFVERMLLQRLIRLCERRLQTIHERGIDMRHSLIITFAGKPEITLDGRSIFQHCAFHRWDQLSPSMQAQMIREGLVVSSADGGGASGALTREAALDCLAFKIARRAHPPRYSFTKSLELQIRKLKQGRTNA